MRALLAAVLLLLAAPGIARAGDVSMVVRDVPLGPRALETAQAPTHFDMVGVHWRGSGTVRYRAHRIGGGWGPWIDADADGGPDPGSPERSAARGWNEGAVDWTGASDRIQFRTHGSVKRLRAYYIWSRVEKSPPVRMPETAGAPAILSRFDWGANEQIVRGKPQYAPRLRLAIIHHTVNANDYTRAQAAAIVRGIETYHVKGNGWNDIGYNFLIDRFGRIYEGRRGGIDRNVIGAHALGFNTGSVGVALIGTFSSVGPTPAQRKALVRLLAWRLDLAHIDPLSTVSFRSLGNPRFPAGSPVRLRAISGHRDTNFTECPGAVLYAELPSIAKAVARTGGPKIYAPAAKAVPPEAVRFTATLSRPAPWTVTVSGAGGETVASGTGSGASIDWTWDGSTSTAGPYRWTIETAGARAATGTLGGSAPPALAPPERAPVEPAPSLPSSLPPLPAQTPTPAPDPQLLGTVAVSTSTLAPAPDGTGGTAQVSFTLAAAATVTAQLLSLDGAVVAEPLDRDLGAGAQTFPLSASGVPDGSYTLVVTAVPDTGTPASSTMPIVVERTLTGLAAASPALSPNGDGVTDTDTFTFALAASLPVRLELRKDGATVATVFSGQLGPGPQTIGWNGAGADGHSVPDGDYRLVATATGPAGEASLGLLLAVDTEPPQLELLDPARLLFSLSEPATLDLTVNGATETKVEPAGTVHVPPPKAGVSSVTAVARDAAGNVSTGVIGP